MDDKTIRLHHECINGYWKLLRRALEEISDDVDWWVRTVDEFGRYCGEFSGTEIEQFAIDLGVGMLSGLERIWQREYGNGKNSRSDQQ